MAADDLLGAVIRTSRNLAAPVVHSYASGNRPYSVRIERPHTMVEFDRATLTTTNPEDEVIYVGPARFARASGGSTLDIGDERMVMTTVQVSIDDYSGPPPRVDDIITVLPDNAMLAQTTGAVGRAFTVLDVEIGGHYDIGYVLTAQGTAPSRRT